MNIIDKINETLNEEPKIFEITRKKYGGGFSVDDLGAVQLLSSKVLGAVVKGKVDLNRLAILALVGRGQNADGKWIGFDESEKLFTKKIK